jgi:hypothetical protein
MEKLTIDPLSCWKCDLPMRKNKLIMKKSIHNTFREIQDEFRMSRWNFQRIDSKVIRAFALALLLWLPIVVNAALTLPAIPSNGSLAKRFELSTELVFRIKTGETYLTNGALVATINGEIRGAQTASIVFPATGNRVYKILVFNDKTSGDSISFKYYDLLAEKIYDIREKIEFVFDQVPDYANPVTLNAFCKPIDKVASGLIPEDGKTNLNTSLDLFWQPSPNTTYYNLFIWEDGAVTPATPTYSNISGTTKHLSDLKYGQLYRWKVASVNDCSSVVSSVQSFRIRQLPDLTVTEIQAPASIESGSNFTVSFKIKNSGPGNTSGVQWYDGIYASTDGVLSNDDKLLTSLVNPKQLDPDSLYTQSVSVSLPIDFTGNYYFLVKTDFSNTLTELSEDNNTGKTTVTTQVVLKPLPDIRVKDIVSDKSTVNAGDSVTISWKVENIGGVPAAGGWAERITFVPVSGLKLSIDPNVNYLTTLPSGNAISRSRKVKLPELLRFSGEANIQVELIPFPDLQEYAGSKVNNTALSANKITVNNCLFLNIQSISLLENVPLPVRCIVTRSGDYSAELVVNLTASLAGQLTIPASVTIPVNQSSFAFDVIPINNALLDGTRDINLTASAANYNSSIKALTILDDELHSITAQLSKSQVTEGETVTLTVSRDLVTAQPLTVSLATNKASQWTFPSSVIIPANASSATVNVTVTDDNTPELKADALIYASSAGLATGQATATILDNDVPEVSFEILSDTVSESAGLYATWGLIKRIKGDGNITVNISSNLANALYIPSSISLPKGVVEFKFNIGVVDNGDVDGYRKATLSGSIYISACNCGTTPENGGVVTANLVIADNDGPSLSVSVLPVSLPEGKLNAGTLTISRNTPTTNALPVTISHNDATEVNIQTTATIPAGQKSVQVPINTINDNVEDGTQMISVQAGAASFSSGFGYFFVTDLNKPDLEITDLAINKATAATNEVIEITGAAYNSGFATAASGVKVKFYCSKNKTIDASDILLGEFAFPAMIPQDTPANFMKTVDVPDETGNFFILAKINPEESLTELAYFNNVSDGVALTITPEYGATAIADNDIYLPNTTIPIHGSAINNQNQKMPNVDIDVYVLNSGTRRELKTKTDNQGDYSVNFVPVPNESGHYIIGACFPKQNLSTEMDNFDIPGLTRVSSSNIIWEMKQGQSLVGKIGIKNTSEATLNKLVITSEKLPMGCELKFDTIAVLSANESKEFTFTLKAKELTVGRDYEVINFLVKSTEGISTDFPAYYYCQALQAQLKADPVSINTTMTKGKSRLYEMYVYNDGAGESGKVSISLPDVSWMTLVSPATIDNISPQDSATLILNLVPNADTPLNTPISGSIAVNCVNGNGVSIPYRFETVSEETGGLKVDVIDEYTYFTDAKPHVKNAHVVVRHPFSGKIIAEGFTGEDGIFSVSNLPEGAYKMNVEADKHEGFQTTLIIDPGRVNEQSVFLSFQAITYTWEVVPTEIEDKYEVQLVMKYETNVPAPVVIMEMPTEMPQLFNDQTYSFMVTLTNKGLITAQDVQLNFPQEDPEYVFITNFTKMNLLAQQAIQVPVLMKRRDALKSASSIESTGHCTDFAFTVYGFECGKDKQWHQTNKGITFSGRVCAGGGGGGGGGWGWGGGGGGGPSRGGGGSTHYDPYNYTSSVAAPTVGCDNCLIDLALAIAGCFPPTELVSGIIGCIKSAADGDISLKDVIDCGVGFTPVGCAYGLLNVAKTCWEDPPIFVKNASLIASIQAKSKMPPIIKQSAIDMGYAVYKKEAIEDWTSQFMGTLDWKSKENFVDFVNQIDPFIKNKQPIQPADLLLIQQKMAGTDITNNEISAFATRWNKTLVAWNLKIFSPTIEHPDIIDNNLLKEYVQKADSAEHYALSRGYTSALEMYKIAFTTMKEQIETGRNSVCASVTIQITQKVVMTREAFEGTLTIFNGNTTTAMKDIKLNLEIKDENGILRNDLFQIDTKALSILTGIDGTGTLGPNEKGSATVLFIPEKGAAPEVPKSYSFGGSFSYLDPFTGVKVTKPLFPVTLDVNPSPDLFLHYFMSRDILGDDALTVPIEPIVPAEFDVMVQNNGYGLAKNVRIESAQPKIVENEKGLAINFALIGSNLNGQPRQLGLTNIDFGNIEPKKSTIGQWWFTSDLLGHFVSYETKLTHLDSRGNPNLSLISGVALHELIKGVRVYSGVEDGINDFLVNEIQDAKEFPDIIYLSNGGTLDVYPAVSQSTSGSIASVSHEIELLVTPKQIGWNYIKFNDPGNGQYKIVSVTRSDGQVIPWDNVWQTFVTLPDGKEPVYENMMHFLDVFAANTTQKYIIKFTPKDQTYPVISSIENVPANAVTSPLSSVNVIFQNPIDPATFNYQDMVLRIQGGPDVMDNTVTVTQINPTTYKVDLTTKTIANGYFVLNVNTSEISNLLGTKGQLGKQVSWTQFIDIPAISEFIGLPENKTGAPFDLLMLRFNLPIDKTTLLPSRFTWKKDGAPVSGTIAVTPMDTEGTLFQLSGLQALMQQNGKYTLSVDLPNIKSLNGINGILPQSVDWEIDLTAPLVNQILPSTDGGYDSQHRTSFTVKFSEPVKGFGPGSVELWKDGLRQPISQLNFTSKSDSTYLITQFRMLTYYEGSYQLKIKMKDIVDFAGNSRSDTVKYNWIVYRKPPKAVTDLRITPDMGFSDTDNVTATRSLTASMVVNEPNTRIRIYQTDQVNPVLLADSANVKAGPLSLPVTFTYGGNITLQAYCIDMYTNQAITEIPVFIDEAALVLNWKNTPQVPVTAQPANLQFEFSDKLLDDSKLKDYLKFERNGQPIGTSNLNISKSTDKLYVLTGMDQAGNATGVYAVTFDLSQLKKYSSGKQGISSSKTEWTIQSINNAPIANAGINQTVNENTVVTLNGSGSSDPDNDALTYLWIPPSGISLSSLTVANPTFTAPEIASDQTFTFGLIVNDGKVNSSVSTVSVTVKNSSSNITQSISLNIGWNIISANVIPANLDMMAIFQPLITAGKLKKVMDEAGNTLENFGVFGGWTNNIGNMDLDRGYKVNVTGPVVLDLQGPPVALPQEISLNVGWNIIGYPTNQILDAMTIFQPLIDATKLKKVMDEAGSTLEDFGFFGGWTNNIGNLVPNKGYKVNMTSAGTLVIPANGTKLAVVPPEIIPSTHFQKIYRGNGTDHATINLVDLAKSGLKVGDEIGIFDGELCVGAAQIGSEQLTRNSISISASCNDGLASYTNGYTPQNPISLRLFRNNKEYLIQPDLQNNSSNIFEKGESMFAVVHAELATGLSEFTQPVSIKCYPNPFKEQVNIELNYPMNQKLEVKIFDIAGKLIRILYEGNSFTGTTLIWDGKNEEGVKLSSGSYFIKANNTVEKVVLSH